MTDLTTIQVTTGQLDALDDLKGSKTEARRETLQRLIDAYESEPDLSENRVREIVREEIEAAQPRY